MYITWGWNQVDTFKSFDFCDLHVASEIAAALLYRKKLAIYTPITLFAV